MADIQTTLGELVNAEGTLRRVVALDGFAAKPKYHVAKLANLVAQETKHWHTERAKLFETLGAERPAATPMEKQAFGPTVREIPPERMADFKTRLDDLNAVTVTIAWAPIRSIDLPAAVKPSDLVDLGPLCELVDPEPEKTNTEPPK